MPSAQFEPEPTVPADVLSTYVHDHADYARILVDGTLDRCAPPALLLLEPSLADEESS